ncbi:MAG: hypothetical protein E3J69_10255 [Anaerolineales bacterium]|nr:MAG: hypothetical protein E3J69_10255 [Anaerolineales bacterium]
MSEEQGKSLSTERIILIVVSTLLVIALIYLGASALARRGQDAPPPDAAPVEPVEEQPAAVLPTEPPEVAETAVDAPAATPTSAVQRLTLEPTPTPFTISDPDDPRNILDLTNPDHVDYFNNPETWYDYITEGVASYEVVDGKLLGTDFDPLNTNIWWSYTSVQSGRVYAEISATNGDCAARDAVGLVIRIEPDITPSGYTFEISCDGEWRFIRLSPGNSVTLIDWTPSDAIVTGLGATNRLGIYGYDGKFYLFINGLQVTDYWDTGMLSSFGYFAAYVRSQVTYPLTATFDDFAFWHLPWIP